MALPLLDANVFLRHLGQDHPDHSPRATAYIQRIENGELRARTTELVIFETIFTLERTYKVPKAIIQAQLLPLLDLPGLVLPGKRRFHSAFRLYTTHNVSFVDAYNAAVVQDLKLGPIVSFDRGYDRIPGITRIEP